MNSKKIITKKPNTKWIQVLFSVLLITMISIQPIIHLYLGNAREMNLSDIRTILAQFWLIGMGFFLFYLVFMRHAPMASIAASVTMLLFQNYMPVQRLLQNLPPHLRHMPMLLLLTVILLHLSYLLYKFVDKDVNTLITKLLVLGFASVYLISIVLAVPTLFSKISDMRKIQQNKADQATTVQGGNQQLPNIYYFIFDEYSRADIMQEYYGYDNAKFVQFLRDSGFVVSDSSRNENYFTSVITANLMNLKYVATSTDSDALLEDYRTNGYMRQILQEKGYQFTGVGQSFYFGVPSVTSENTTAIPSTEAGLTATDLIWQKTPLAPFIKQSFWLERGSILLDSRDYFQDPVNYTLPHNQFTMTYLEFPHVPFVFKADGSYVDMSDSQNWKNLNIYLGQYIYTSKMMQQMVEGIIKNDPEAIIIIQSDHGARSVRKNGDIIPDKDKIKIFNAVYFQGKAIDIEGLSGVNTLRLVFTNALDLDLPPLEVPYADYAE